MGNFEFWYYVCIGFGGTKFQEFEISAYGLQVPRQTTASIVRNCINAIDKRFKLANREEILQKDAKLCVIRPRRSQWRLTHPSCLFTTVLDDDRQGQQRSPVERWRPPLSHSPYVGVLRHKPTSL